MSMRMFFLCLSFAAFHPRFAAAEHEPAEPDGEERPPAIEPAKTSANFCVKTRAQYPDAHAISNSGDAISVIDDHRDAQFFSGRDGKQLKKFSLGRTSAVYWTLSPDAEQAAVVDDKNHGRLIDMRTGDVLMGWDGKQEPLTFSHDKRYLVNGGQVLDLKHPPKSVQGAPDDRYLPVVASDSDDTASVDVGGKILTWDLATGKKISEIATEGNGWVKAVHGKQVFTVDDAQKKVRAYDAVTKRLLKTTALESPAFRYDSYSMSSDGSKIAIVTGHKTVRVYSTDTGKELERHDIEGDTNPDSYTKMNVAFSPDGKRLVGTGGNTPAFLCSWSLQH